MELSSPGETGVTDAATKEPPRFLCDEMLSRLSRWLRAAGYDAEGATEESDDRALVACAQTENRMLLTRDRRIPKLRLAGARVFLLKSGLLDAQAAELASGLALDWLYRPFSRCLLCNVSLRQALDDEIAEIVRRPGIEPPFNACPECQRVYWTGGHTRRMRERLTAWAGLEAVSIREI